MSLVRPSLANDIGVANLALMENHRHTASPLDELLFHMMKCKQPRLVSALISMEA